MTDQAHSRLGASSMHRWSKCPGSVRLCEGIPQTTSVYAEEGTRAHKLAADTLEYIFQEGPSPELTDFEDETLDAVNTYVDVIQTDIAKYGDGPGSYKVLIEVKFDLSSVYPGCFGTADCVVYFFEPKLLIVYDYKNGQGIAVDVLENGKPNSQLQYYGVGAELALRLPCEELVIVVVQPRCPHPDGPVRRLSLPSMASLDFCADLIDFAKATTEPNARLNPGSHCRFCPAAGVCPALRNEAQLVAKEVFSPALSYDPAKLAEALNKVHIAEAWVKNVREFAYSEAAQGRTPPGWKLVPKRATRRWKPGVDATSLTEEIGDEVLAATDFVEEKLKSPAQVEKMLKGPKKKLIAGLVVAESSGASLVPDGDKREAIAKGPQSCFSEIPESTN